MGRCRYCGAEVPDAFLPIHELFCRLGKTVDVVWKSLMAKKREEWRRKRESVIRLVEEKAKEVREMRDEVDRMLRALEAWRPLVERGGPLMFAGIPLAWMDAWASLKLTRQALDKLLRLLEGEF